MTNFTGVAFDVSAKTDVILIYWINTHYWLEILYLIDIMLQQHVPQLLSTNALAKPCLKLRPSSRSHRDCESHFLEVRGAEDDSRHDGKKSSFRE